MARICYVWKDFRDDALQTIDTANEICEEYQQQGYDLTLRQLYYVFVSRDLIPNTIQSYKRLGDIINDARMAGLLDWDYIVDRTRNLMAIPHFTDGADSIRTAARRYAIDLWANQPTRVEVWVEKEALAGIVAGAANVHDCAYFSCRGYTSQSELWGAAQRLGDYMRAGQNVVVLHLGDHDPSGIDMTRDIVDRLNLFTAKDNEDRQTALAEEIGRKALKESGVTAWAQVPEEIRSKYAGQLRRWRNNRGTLRIERIALNLDQIEQYNPPPNPAKITDSRAKKYIERFGRSSWELDALDPATLDALIQSHIRNHKDASLWNEAINAQENERATLTDASVRWDEVQEFLRDSE